MIQRFFTENHSVINGGIISAKFLADFNNIYRGIFYSNLSPGKKHKQEVCVLKLQQKSTNGELLQENENTAKLQPEGDWNKLLEEYQLNLSDFEQI